MSNGYSNDFRKRAMAYYEEGHTQVETCEIFGMSRATLCNWIKQKKETGSVALKPRPKQRRRKIDETALRTYIEAHPDAYYKEISEAFGVSDMAIIYACRRYGITRKKRRHAT